MSTWTCSRPRMLPTVVTTTCAALLIGGVVGAPAPAAAAGAGNGAMTRIAATPRVPSSATRIGRPAASARIAGDVSLKPRDPAAVMAAATAVSNPKSPDYKRYLTPGQFRSAYGPSSATISTVESTLRAAHLTVSSVSSNGLLVHFSGTAAQAGAAFRSPLASYRLASGRTGVQMTAAPAFPSTVASQVTGVIGLETLSTPGRTIERWTKKGSAHAMPLTRSATGTAAPGAPSPCHAATQNAQRENGLTFDGLAHAYGLDGLFRGGDLGAGQHIAVFEEAPYVPQDIAAFESCYFGASRQAAMAKRLRSTLVDGGAGTGFGIGSDEADLDVEDVAAFAPRSDIDVYTGPLTSLGYLDTFDRIITQDTDQFVTTSWVSGINGCEQVTKSVEPGLLDTENQLFEQAALQGQTVLAAAGDSGSDTCAGNGNPTPTAPFVSTADPASQPFVTAVGGTAITNDSNRPREQVWNDGNYGGSGGGGASSLWSAPSWQGTAIATIDPSVFAAAYGSGAAFGHSSLAAPCPQATASDPAVCRTVPDVTAEADEFTGAPGVFIRAYGGWVDFGGTSSSTPLWAAMLADVQASSDCRAAAPLGFVSPTLYAIGANPHEDAASFNDVTVGNNDAYGLSSGKLFAATKGYDLASGLGSPRLTARDGKPALAAYLCARPAAGVPAVTSLSPAVEPLSPTQPLTISGSNFTTATAVSIGTYQVPRTGFQILSGNQIRVATPPPAASQTGGDTGETGAGRAAVSVTGPSGTSADTPASQLEYVDTSGGGTIPSVTLVNRDLGTQAGGTHVEVYGSGFMDGPSSNVTSVTVGGVPATAFTVASSYRLDVTVPAYQSGVTTCASLGTAPSELCQTQLVVSGPHGSSSTATIKPLYEGAIDGSTPCTGCATSPAATEFDYLPAPTVTKLSSTYVSEFGDTIEVIHGHGFAQPGLQWVAIGNPAKAANREYDFEVFSATPDEIDVAINGVNRLTVASIKSTLRIVTMAGSSAPSDIVYAGTPHVTAVSPHAGPVSGGTTITVTGEGLSQVRPENGGYLEYGDVYVGIPRDQYAGYTVHNRHSLTATTPQTLAGTDAVTACSVTSCSFPSSRKSLKATQFVFYPPGNPSVRSVSPRKGPASGGTPVTIKGRNLSVITSVTFGKRKATLTSREIYGDSDPYELTLKAPPGKPGRNVAVRVTTVESRHAPGGEPSRVTTATRYRYLPSPPSAPRHVKAHKHDGGVRVTWHKPLVNGGAVITGYRVAVTAVNLFAHKLPKPTVVTLPAKARSATLPHLTGDLILAKVRAINRHGSGPAAGFIVGPKFLTGPEQVSAR